MTAKLVRISTTTASCDIPSLIPIEVGDTISFGRSKDADVYLDSTAVKNMISRSHAKLVSDRVSGRVSIFDLNSTNGVYVNDKKIDVCHLTNGDRVTFGGRGKNIAVGTIDPQPTSEFIYEFQQELTEEGEESAFETAKSFTDNIQVILTWITTAVVVGSYLFADESSEEFSYVADYVAPLFHFIGLPFTRLTFTVTFVLIVGIVLGASIWIVKKGKSGKGAGKKKQ